MDKRSNHLDELAVRGSGDDGAEHRQLLADLQQLGNDHLCVGHRSSR